MNRNLTYPLFALFALTFWLLPCTAAESPAVVASLDEARVALKANDLVKAAALLEPLTRADAADAAAFYLLSQVRLAQKDAKAAVEAAEKATVFDATKAAHFSQLGLALSQRMAAVPFQEQAVLAGKLRKALVKAVELDPNDIGGLIGLARFYTNAPEIAGGSLEKAKEYALRVQRLDPYLGAAELGNVAERDENYTAALGHYEAAIKLRPGNPAMLSACGRVLAKLGRKEEARARFEAALKINPELAAAKRELAALDAPAP